MLVHIANVALALGRLRWKLQRAHRAARNIRAKSGPHSGPTEAPIWPKEHPASRKWRRNHQRAEEAIVKISRQIADKEAQLNQMTVHP